MKRLMFITVLSLVSVNAVAANSASYAGQEGREIKALSNEEVQDYLNGSGMGYAKAAELNYFPGPRHVLDLGHELRLSHEQMKQTQRIFNAMKKAASSFGAQLVEKERELDRKFADDNLDEQTLSELVTEIGVLEGRIRRAHLKAHLEQRKLLNEHQILRYAELRGYTGAHESKHIHAH